MTLFRSLALIPTDENRVVTQPTIKIQIWSRKAKISLIRVWHNGNLPQGTNTIGLSRMMPQSQLIFDKSDSVRSRTEECKNLSHTLKLKNSEVIIIQAAEILAYMSLNSSWKINPTGPLMWRGACRGDSPRELDSAGQRPRRALCLHDNGVGRKWRRVPGASQPGKIPGIFSKINRPAWRLNVESCSENNF